MWSQLPGHLKKLRVLKNGFAIGIDEEGQVYKMEDEIKVLAKLDDEKMISLWGRDD